MTKVNLSAARKKAEEAGHLGGGAAWKPKEGDNRIRLVSEFLEHPGSYNGKKTFKWLCFVLDRADGEVKPYFMPHNVYEQIEKLQLSPDYAFDEVPMPYDITLNAKNAGKLDVVYTVIPARANTPLTPGETERVTAAGSLREYQASVYESQNGTQSDQPERTINIEQDSAPLPEEPPPASGRYNSVPQQFRPQA